METLLKGLVTKLCSFTASAIDIAIAYLIIDHFWGYILTWPMILLAWWVTDTAMTPGIRKDLWD